MKYTHWLADHNRYGASLGGPLCDINNLILRLFLYHFLYTLSSWCHKSIHNNTNTQQTSPPWWWSRLPLQRCIFDDFMPPKGRAALHIYCPRPLSKDLNRFIKLKWLLIYFYQPLWAWCKPGWGKNVYTRFAWAGGTCPRFAWAGRIFSPVVLLCQILVLAGNSFVARNSSQNENTFWFPMSSFYKKILLGYFIMIR